MGMFLDIQQLQIQQKTGPLKALFLTPTQRMEMQHTIYKGMIIVILLVRVEELFDGLTGMTRCIQQRLNYGNLKFMDALGL